MLVHRFSNNNNEQNHNDVDTNKEQHMSLCENINQVDGTNICKQRAPCENISITNVHCSSANNASVYTRTRQASATVINVDDDDSTTEDDNQPKCAICNNKIISFRDEGYADTKKQCTCKHNYHHYCLMQMREHCLSRKINMKCHKCNQQILTYWIVKRWIHLKRRKIQNYDQFVRKGFQLTLS